MTLSDCRHLSFLWLSLLDERRKFLDFIRLPTMALYWSLGILFTSSTLLSQLFFVFANKHDVATVCFYVCPKFSLSLQTNMMLLQSVFMFVPSFLCLCKKICWFAICFYVCPRLPLFCKKYYVVAIFLNVCPKIPLFCKKLCCFCNFFLCLSQDSFVFAKNMLFLQFSLMSVPSFWKDILCWCDLLYIYTALANISVLIRNSYFWAQKTAAQIPD